MNRQRRTRDYTSDAIRQKHAAIRQRYEELLRKEREINPLRAQFLAKGYYVELICRDPVIGLSRNYVQRIINHP